MEAGAKLYTYAAGTSTPLVSYSNVGLSAPHENPVVANSAGRLALLNGVAAAVYLTDAKYKLVLKDATEATTLGEIDNYGGIDADAISGVATDLLKIAGKPVGGCHAPSSAERKPRPKPGQLVAAMSPR